MYGLCRNITEDRKRKPEAKKPEARIGTAPLLASWLLASPTSGRPHSGADRAPVACQAARCEHVPADVLLPRRKPASSHCPLQDSPAIEPVLLSSTSGCSRDHRLSDPFANTPRWQTLMPQPPRWFLEFVPAL